MVLKSFSFDAQKKKTIKGRFKPSTQAEQRFFKQLKKVAQASGHIVEQHTEGAQLVNSSEMQRRLDSYAKSLEPWARLQAAKLLEEVQRSNKRAYRNKSKAIGNQLDLLTTETDVGVTAIDLITEQVELIKSIPIEAGLRAQKVAFEAVLSGTRAAPDEDTVKELEKQLGMSTEVAISRARLIARTETARANAKINQARAQAVGSNQYRWHNSGDEAVRHSHKFYKGKRLQGMIFSWDNPPTLDDGMTGHPGTFPNCRCFAEPVFDTE